MSARGQLSGAIASKYAALLAQIGFVLALTPYVINRRGADVDGAWAIVMAVAGYLRLLDLGIGQATARAPSPTTDVSAERQAIVAASLGVLCLAGVAGIIGSLGIDVVSFTVSGARVVGRG